MKTKIPTWAVVVVLVVVAVACAWPLERQWTRGYQSNAETNANIGHWNSLHGGDH